MNFWSTVLACMLGFLLWDILISVIKVGARTFKDHMEEKTRKIGFGDSDEPEKKSKTAPQMRKIGFGEND